MITRVAEHYDLLIKEGNDPVLDPAPLREYMDKWDGPLFMDLLALEREKSVLEIGCGTGRLAVKVAPQVGRFCGMDISPETVSVARAHLEGTGAEIICADLLSCDLREKFHVVYSSLTFMHIKDKEGAISRVSHLLHDGGRFVLSIDKSRDTFLKYGDRTLEIYPDTPEGIGELLSRHGFYGIEVYETEFAYVIVGKK